MVVLKIPYDEYFWCDSAEKLLLIFSNFDLFQWPKPLQDWRLEIFFFSCRVLLYYIISIKNHDILLL